MRTNPLVLIFIGLFRLVTGRYCFERAEIGRCFVMEDGRVFRIFRRVVRRNKNLPPAEAAFRVRFKPRNMGIEENVRFSRLPMVVMLGFPGFRAKYWTVEDATGMCQGIYEWDSLADVERYVDSIALRFMAGRSEPGSVSYEIFDQRQAPYWACQGPNVEVASPM